MGCGSNSGTVSAFAAEVPSAVRDVRLGEPSGSSVELRWTAPLSDGMNSSSGGVKVFSYDVEMDRRGAFVSLGNTTATSFLVENLQLQFAYVFRTAEESFTWR